MTANEHSREALALKERCDALEKKNAAKEHRPTVEQLRQIIRVSCALEADRNRREAAATQR